MDRSERCRASGAAKMTAAGRAPQHHTFARSNFPELLGEGLMIRVGRHSEQRQAV
jgi:hypothetical protein